MTGAPKDIKTIGIVTAADYDQFNLALCKELKRLTGCRVVFYVSGLESMRSHERFRKDGIIDEIVDRDVLLPAASRMDVGAEAVFTRAQEMEDFIGCTYNEVMMTRRDIGRGFALGGYYHPRMPGVDRMSYVQVIHGVSENLAFWRNEFESKRLDLIINGQKDAAVVARALGIPYRFLYSSRVGNYYYWSRDEFFEVPGLRESYDRLEGGRFEPIEIDQPYFQEIKSRAKSLRGSAFVRFLRQSVRWLMRQAYLTLKGYRSPWDYSILSGFTLYGRRVRDLRKTRPPFTQSLASLRGLPFVFYPLQTEPEMALQWMSPECFCQLGVIASLARDLPAGVILAVKDTIHAVGRRPNNFYDQIRDFKNVAPLDVMERGVDVVGRAAAVATISSTAGLEAAIMGKPVIMFGRHNGYQFVPHVHLVTREEDLRPALRRALDGSIDRNRAARDGARLRRALVNASFDLGQFDPLRPGSFDQAGIAAAASALLDSVRPKDTATAA